MPSRQPRWPSIGLNSCSSAARRRSASTPTPAARGDLGELLLAVRQEFVQRRIEQADGDRQAGHDPEDLGEIAALGGQQLGERARGGRPRPRRGSSGGRWRSARRRRTYARCGTGRCPRRRTRARCGSRAASRHWRGRSSRRFASAQAISVPKSPTSSGWTVGDLAEHHLAGRAVDGDRRRPRATSRPPTRISRALIVDRERAGAARRRAGPCRARPPRRGWSCRRAR